MNGAVRKVMNRLTFAWSCYMYGIEIGVGFPMGAGADGLYTPLLNPLAQSPTCSTSIATPPTYYVKAKPKHPSVLCIG